MLSLRQNRYFNTIFTIKLEARILRVKTMPRKVYFWLLLSKLISGPFFPIVATFWLSRWPLAPSTFYFETVPTKLGRSSNLTENNSEFDQKFKIRNRGQILLCYYNFEWIRQFNLVKNYLSKSKTIFSTKICLKKVKCDQNWGQLWLS